VRRPGASPVLVNRTSQLWRAEACLRSFCSAALFLPGA
jgi:hypothetical protein